MEVKVVIPGEGTESLLVNREDEVLMWGSACTVEAETEAARTYGGGGGVCWQG